MYTCPKCGNTENTYFNTHCNKCNAPINTGIKENPKPGVDYPSLSYISSFSYKILTISYVLSQISLVVYPIVFIKYLYKLVIDNYYDFSFLLLFLYLLGSVLGFIAIYTWYIILKVIRQVASS